MNDDAIFWSAFEEALSEDAEPTAEEMQAICRVVDERCVSGRAAQAARLREFVSTRLNLIAGTMSDFALAAASNGTTGEAKDASRTGETVTFVFVSDALEHPSDRTSAWRAELQLPADVGVDEMLSISLVDGEGEPIQSGIFRVAGVSLPVANGHAEIPYGLFLSGMRDVAVEYVNAQGVGVTGTLALF